MGDACRVVPLFGQAGVTQDQQALGLVLRR